MNEEEKNRLRVIVCRPGEVANSMKDVIEITESDYVLLSEEDVEKEIREDKTTG